MYLGIIIGNGFMELVVLAIVLSMAAFKWPRFLAPLFGAIAVLLAAYLAASILLKLSFPYQTWNISIYLLFFFAVMFAFSALIGAARYIHRRSSGT